MTSFASQGTARTFNTELNELDVVDMLKKQSMCVVCILFP